MAMPPTMPSRRPPTSIQPSCKLPSRRTRWAEWTSLPPPPTSPRPASKLRLRWPPSASCRRIIFSITSSRFSGGRCVTDQCVTKTHLQSHSEFGARRNQSCNFQKPDSSSTDAFSNSEAGDAPHGGCPLASLLPPLVRPNRLYRRCPHPIGSELFLHSRVDTSNLQGPARPYSRVSRSLVMDGARISLSRAMGPSCRLRHRDTPSRGAATGDGQAQTRC